VNTKETIRTRLIGSFEQLLIFENTIETETITNKSEYLIHTNDTMYSCKVF